MNTVNIFEDIAVLEPKCPRCESIIKLGVNTRFDAEKKAHVCIKCSCVLK